MNRESRTGLHLVARIGYAARGLIYVVVGSFAVLAAAGAGGETTDSRGALVEVLNAPFGKVLLGLVAAGLAAYALWRAVQALLDADDHGTDARGLAIRAGLAVSAIAHAGLALAALGLLFGRGAGGSGRSSSQEWTATLMSQPWGAWLVGAAGLAIIGAGVAHGIKAWRAGFRKRLDIDEQEQRYIMPVSRFGLCARGAVFVIIGAFVVTAAVQHDPSEARGLSGALQALQDQPYGWMLLGVVAIGLIAFGAYSIIESIYRRIGAV